MNNYIPSIGNWTNYFYNDYTYNRTSSYPPNIITNLDQPKNTSISKIIHNPELDLKLDYIDSDGQLNELFFRRFRHHNEYPQYSTKDILNQNLDVYETYLNNEILEPKVSNLVRPPDEIDQYERANATFISLVRNSELQGIISAMKEVEKKFNKNFNYPWTFLNDREFTKKFIEKVQKNTNAECHFIRIPSHLWDKPFNIDSNREKEGIKYLINENIQYANKISYHNMCRFYSGNFYNIDHLKNFKYYWRIEPSTSYFTKINYDVFKFMELNKKTYGFTISLYDSPQSVHTLWNATINFLKQNLHYINKNPALDWLLYDLQNPHHNAITSGYSTCHFWSNFEIADMDFFRSKPYTEYFNYLDNEGGFYYERWGDAPVHSLGLALFEDKSKIHWFRDIGYKHFPYFNCPNNPDCEGCEKGSFSEYANLNDQNCLPTWIKYEMTDEQLNLY
ncbi:putative mannosyltransferase [Ascoidea rubescens DSM 1968]|uniref:Glycosyltransferase family 15 protein n=1 Tax=Ascoidea rubescens DSM 1968 TaxID=1344418 RepID=A0A1D2VII1_9ASCO|nr:glycosyltransferase family 15 protein [Ascoidea rubescens DSM 1968]ODV61429.1 glycosyltransferase family 15 protein [Ascoidea rubescens DSM 1968]